VALVDTKHAAEQNSQVQIALKSAQTCSHHASWTPTQVYQCQRNRNGRADELQGLVHEDLRPLHFVRAKCRGLGQPNASFFYRSFSCAAVTSGGTTAQVVLTAGARRPLLDEQRDLAGRAAGPASPRRLHADDDDGRQHELALSGALSVASPVAPRRRRRNRPGRGGQWCPRTTPKESAP
jgi:hypothetical protein